MQASYLADMRRGISKLIHIKHHRGTSCFDDQDLHILEWE